MLHSELPGLGTSGGRAIKQCASYWQFVLQQKGTWMDGSWSGLWQGHNLITMSSPMSMALQSFRLVVYGSCLEPEAERRRPQTSWPCAFLGGRVRSVRVGRPGPNGTAMEVRHIVPCISRDCYRLLRNPACLCGSSLRRALLAA